MVHKLAAKIREVEEQIAAEYHKGEMRCPVHLSTGQEDVAAGVCMNLNIDDSVVSSHRSHAHYIAKGGNIERMLDEIKGLSSGCSKGFGGSMHLVDESVCFFGSTAIVAGTIPVGVGLGLSFKLKKENRISCIFFGDGAVEEGVFYEAINFAAVKKLPCLFVCENNGFSVYSPLEKRQPKSRSMQRMVERIGVPGISADGSDAYTVSSIACAYIREGNGPFFLEFETKREREHCGPNKA